MHLIDIWSTYKEYICCGELYIKYLSTRSYEVIVIILITYKYFSFIIYLIIDNNSIIVINMFR